MRTISIKGTEKFISTAKKLEKRGIEKGIKKVAYSLIKQGIPDEIILKATKLTKEQLDYLKTIKDY